MAIPRTERQTTSEVCQLLQNVAFSRCPQSLGVNRSCSLLILSADMNSKPWLCISCAQIESLQVPYPFLWIPVHTGIQWVFFLSWFWELRLKSRAQNILNINSNKFILHSEESKVSRICQLCSEKTICHFNRSYSGATLFCH